MGGKRVTLDSKFHPQKCSKKKRHSSSDDDRISQLPDDILVGILSLLPLKQAARTSLLSSRWINLWKHTPCLDFDADSVFNKIAATDRKKQHKLCLTERRKYIKWVNRVLQSHKAPTLTQFRICFDLNKSSRKSITSWLEFALSRHVQRLELDLLDYGGFISWIPKIYVLDLPEDLILIGLKSLTALTLKCVNVTGKAVESLLRNCPLLEELVIHGTDGIRTLEVCGGPSLMLKHLDIFFLDGLETMKVSAPKLVSLKVDKLKGLLLENVPMLVELSVILGKDPILELVPVLECCKSQLEILNLEVFDPKDEDYNFPELSKLKKLVVTCSGRDDKSVIGLSSLIRASPYLEEFVFKLKWSGLSRIHRRVKECETRLPHQHLKVFKFCGYYGRTSDAELVKYVVKNCLVLEKVIIESNYIKSSRTPLSNEKRIAQQTARKCAKQQLEGQLPQSIELVIL